MPTESEVYPRQVVVFKCIVKYSAILAWRIIEYFGVGHELSFTSGGQPGMTLSEGSANATLISVNHTEQAIESILRLGVLDSPETARVTCHNSDIGVNTSMALHISGKARLSLILSMAVFTII